MDSVPAYNHAFTTDNGPPAKRFKGSPEVPAHYSDAVRKKLASTTRTGQACDRCKERKMKCDTNPTACLPCRTKNLRCLTTDRVTGKASERGQSDRQESELHELRRHLASYTQKYGPLEDKDLIDDYPTAAETIHNERRTPRYNPDSSDSPLPSQSRMQDLHTGPVNGTVVDLIGDEIDIANFSCPEMEDYDMESLNVFNTSKTSLINTLCGVQHISDPGLPKSEEGLKFVKHFLTYIWPYVPIFHRPSFSKLAKDYYTDPNSVTVSELMGIVMVFTIISHQSAVRNPPTAVEMMERSNRWLHYVLSNYRQLANDTSQASMQAMVLLVTHFRNLPKPGYSWHLTHTALVRAVDLDYHRSPDKVKLPAAEDNPLGREVRKRIFWSLLGVCTHILVKQGKPAPWQLSNIDVEIPMAIRDNEISKDGLIDSRSGRCDFWVALRLFKIVPLLMELYNNLICVRRPSAEYVQIVESLNTRVSVWRKEWDRDISVEENNMDGEGATQDDMRVATLHVEIWAAEFQLVLHHPKLDCSGDPEISERNLETCHSCSKRLFLAFRTLSQRHRGADFTWHTTVAYALAFGIVLHIYTGWKDRATPELLETMQIELREWLVVMGLADTVMKTNNFLMREFNPRVQRIEGEYQRRLGFSPGTNNFQSSQPVKSKTFFTPQAEQTAANQSHYGNSRTMDIANHQSAANGSLFPPNIYPHPPLFPEPFQFQSYATSMPAPHYANYPPTTDSHHTQYTHQTHVPTSLAPLLNNSILYPSYPTFGSGSDVYADYTDERSYWPTSVHESVYQGLPPQ